eukprot:TRINITY_DN68231_c0_g1_i1.p1 TRINITY_DN68231_c0_g1~~TRINITY_DN68231_c0_g1_i1.p1  ORF type:complete len:313 (-),score=5.89 TRINITY_DN68231_c0_g1_i1:810-1748(-)
MARVVPFLVSSLYVSRPSPHLFGNPPNDPSTPGWSEHSWLTSRFHFNFAECDSQRNSFGVLRVLNDDLVMPRRGFGPHPHRDMEIVTYVVSGELTHRDSHGNLETLTAGSIQFMSAGSGVTHSESNINPSRPVRFIQSWIVPRRRGTPVQYGSYSPPHALPTDAVTSCTSSSEGACPLPPHNTWTHLVGDASTFARLASTPQADPPHSQVAPLLPSPSVTGDSSDRPPVVLNQDANLFVAHVDAHAAVSVRLHPLRAAYLVVLEGAATADGKRLADGDAAELHHPGSDGPVDVRVEALAGGAHLYLFELAKA